MFKISCSCVDTLSNTLNQNKITCTASIESYGEHGSKKFEVKLYFSGKGLRIEQSDMSYKLFQKNSNYNPIDKGKFDGNTEEEISKMILSKLNAEKCDNPKFVSDIINIMLNKEKAEEIWQIVIKTFYRPAGSSRLLDGELLFNEKKSKEFIWSQGSNVFPLQEKSESLFY